jgi:hypothetical protein
MNGDNKTNHCRQVYTTVLRYNLKDFLLQLHLRITPDTIMMDIAIRKGRRINAFDFKSQPRTKSWEKIEIY